MNDVELSFFRIARSVVLQLRALYGGNHNGERPTTCKEREIRSELNVSDKSKGGKSGVALIQVNVRNEMLYLE